MAFTQEQANAIIELAKQVLTKDIAPPVTCQTCGADLPTHADAMNVALVVQVGVPGHAAIPAFQCPMPEHWSCCTDCFRTMAIDCLDNHIIPLLEHAHEKLGRQTPVQKGSVRNTTPATHG